MLVTRAFARSVTTTVRRSGRTYWEAAAARPHRQIMEALEAEALAFMQAFEGNEGAR
jgi:hypothetical protein